MIILRKFHVRISNSDVIDAQIEFFLNLELFSIEVIYSTRYTQKKLAFQYLLHIACY